MSERVRPLRVLGVSLALCLAPAVYAIARVVERAISPEQDPAAIIWTERSTVQARLMVTAFVTIVALWGALGIAQRWPQQMPRVVAIAAVGACVLLLVQTTVWP